jgi:hypothetical protein
LRRALRPNPLEYTPGLALRKGADAAGVEIRGHDGEES